MPTDAGKPTKSKGGEKRGPARPVRILPVFLICAAVAAAGAAAALYGSRDLLRHVAEERLRVFLEKAGSVEYHVASDRFRLIPPGIELEGVVVGSVGEAWVLTVDEASIDLSPAALFFRGTGAARLRLVRPRYIQRGREPSAAAGPPGAASVDPGKGRFDPSTWLAGKIPFRSVEIVDGEIFAARGGGEGLEVSGLDVTAALSGGRLIGQLHFDDGYLVRSGTVWGLGRADLDLTLDSDRATVKSFRVEAPLLEGDLSGAVTYDGRMKFNFSAAVPVDGITDRLGGGRPLQGRLAMEGRISGPVSNPAIKGRAVLHDPVVGGQRWPDVKGTVAWKEGRFLWRDLSADVRGGALSTSGFVKAEAGIPHYGFTVTARDFYPASLPPFSETAAEKVRNVNATLRWEGRGIREDTLAGSGTVRGLFGIEGREWAPVDIEGRASLVAGTLEIDRADLRSGDSLLRTRGSYRFEEGLILYLEATVGSLAKLLDLWEVEGFDGMLFAEGELTAGSEGFLFEGPVRWENGEAFGLHGFGATASVSIDGSEIVLDNGRVAWRGSEIEASGRLLMRERQIDLLTNWKDLNLSTLAPLLGIDEGATGEITVAGQLIGGWEEPILSGRFQARDLHYGGIVVEGAEGALSFAGETLNLSKVSIRSRESTLVFSGEIEGERLSGTLESPKFDLRAFVPASAADAVGIIQADLGGTVSRPRADGEYVFFSLNYENWSFKGTEGEFEYRDDTFTLRGSLADEANSYRLRLEPRGDWPFEGQISLGSFSPELAREGFLGLPADLRQVVQELSFLAVGEFDARGMLKDLKSIRASLDIETIWVYTEKQTLQNLAPLRVLWENGVVSVEEFAVAGEDYRVSLSGRGGPEAGWDVALDGHVNLSIFKTYWKELEEIDAPGNVKIRLTGPWEDPEVTGSFNFDSGVVKIAGLEEPITGIAGSGDLAGGVFVLDNFSGSMGDNHFHAAGSIDLESREVDAFVEGHLDLSVFRRRVPGTREMKGPVSARLTLRGSADRPRILGEAVLEGAELFHQAIPQKITGLSGKILLEEKGLVIEELAGKMGRGEIALEGFLDWSVEPVRVEVGLAASKVLFVMEGIAKALLSADLTLSGDFDGLKLAGDIEFHKARYFREFKDKIKKVPGLPSDAAGGDRGGPARGPDLEKTVLDVTITAPDRFWIVNSTVDLENSVAIHLGGTVAEPLLDGEIRLLRGEATYFSRRFTLFSGRIFNTPPGINPTVEAQAEVVVGDTRIFLLLEGPLRKPTLQLTSLPPLNQGDLIALLTVGQTKSSLEEQKGESLAIGAAIVFGTPLIEQIGEGARDVSGIEYFQVQPALTEETSSAKVTLGTQLSDRLFMSASQTIGVTEEQQVRLEYQILDYVSVLGQQLRQGIYTLDLVVQFDFD